MAANSTRAVGCMVSFWQSLETSPEKSSEIWESSSFCLLNSAESTSRDVHWMIENRGGLAKIAGLMMPPSKSMGPSPEKSADIFEDFWHQNQDGYYFIRPFQHNTVKGLVYYPVGWDKSDTNRCVLYHSPNGATLLQFLQEGKLSWTPAEIVNLKKCPIILYDYRGTGVNQLVDDGSSSTFLPTYETVVEDGLSALDFALDEFTHVDIWGSSLGGGVATASLAKYLDEHSNDMERVTLTNHDSFTTTPRVVFPSLGIVADALGWAVGGTIDAQTAMERLIQRDVKVIVLCHERDPVIPEGARMAEFVSAFKNPNNVSIICSPLYGHANLSLDMLSNRHSDKKLEF